MTEPCLHTAKLLDGVADEQLAGPTPCERLTLSELVAHVGDLGVAFAAAGRKDLGQLTGSPPGDGGYLLADDWRAQYPGNLAGLADAWRDPGAWSGLTQIGGVDLPGEVCAMVGLTEVVIHGWDVALPTSQALRPTVRSRACSGPWSRSPTALPLSTAHSRSVAAIPGGS